MDRQSELWALHPNFRKKIVRVIERLDIAFHDGRIAHEFRLFETYRDPVRQHALFLERPRVTQADAWQSAHNYGVACDFVGWVKGGPSWDAGLDWDMFAKIVAEQPGCHVPIKWDKGHVEWTQWPKIRAAYEP